MSNLSKHAAAALLALSLQGCLGNNGESDPASTLTWNAPTSIPVGTAEYTEVAALSGGSSLVMQRGVQGTEDVVTLTFIGREGATPIQYQLLRVPNLNCCAAPWGGMRLKADNRGGAHLVWMERMSTPPYRRLNVRYYQETNGLSAQWTVIGTPGNAVRAFDLSIRANGVGLLGWIESTPDSPTTEALGPSAAYAVEVSMTGPTSTPVRLSETIPIDQSGFFSVSTAVSDNGYGMVLWTRAYYLQTAYDLWGTTATPQGVWGTATRLSRGQAGGSTVESFAGAIGMQGTAVVAWEWAQGIDFNTLSHAGQWAGPSTLANTSQRPSVGIATTNRAFVTYVDRTQTNSVQNSIRLARFESGQLTSTEIVTPIETQPYYVGVPSLGVLSDGTAVLSWSETLRTGGTSYVQRKTLNSALVWMPTLRVSTQDSITFGRDPSVFVSGGTNVSLFWSQNAELWLQTAQPAE